MNATTYRPPTTSSHYPELRPAPTTANTPPTAPPATEPAPAPAEPAVEKGWHPFGQKAVDFHGDTHHTVIATIRLRAPRPASGSCQIVTDSRTATAAAIDAHPDVQRLRRIAGQLADAERERDLAGSRAAEMEATRSRLVLEAAPGLAGKLADIDQKLPGLKAAHVTAAAAVDTLAGVLAQARTAAQAAAIEIAKRSADERIAAFGAERRRRTEELAAAATPALYQLAALRHGGMPFDQWQKEVIAMLDTIPEAAANE